MNVVSDSLKSGSALADDYINHYARVQDLYGADFREDGAWTRRAEWLDASEETRIDRKALAACLRQYNRKHNDHPEVHKSLDLLEQAGTLAVVGGQQSGLFTGSLLVVYKALTIVLAAKEAAERLNRPVVPVFWIAGEDHDWDEVNHTHVMTPEFQIAKIKMDAAPGPRGPVSQLQVTKEQWKRSLEQLANLLPDSVNKPAIMDLLHQTAETSGNLSDAFAKLLGRLFGASGLILLDSADPELRRLEIPVFERIIKQNDELGETYQAAAANITSRGYPLQADVTEDCANLFYIHEGNRLLLHKHNGAFVDRKGIVNFTKEELELELKSHPERFSNNVLTRPLMQDSLLPVLCTVLGQGEISYWAITKGAFSRLGLQMPILLPRMSFTFISGTVRKYMNHFGLTFQDVQHRFAEARERWLNSQAELHIEPRFEETRAAFEKLYEPLVRELGTIQSGLLPLGEKNKDKILEQIAYLERKTKQALEKRHEAALRQWDCIAVSLFPNGKPQERVYNIFYYINRYGFSWIQDIMGSCTRYAAEHQIIEM